MLPASLTRGRARLTVLAVCAVVAAGCAGAPSGDEPAQPTQQTPMVEEQLPREELNVWVGSIAPLVPNFNPFSRSALPGVKGGIYESLFVFNPVADIEPVPVLATDAQFNDDGTVLTVTLREGVRWNDGHDLSVDDVVFSYTHEPIAPQEVASAVKVDDHTVELLLNGPHFNHEPRILQHPIVPEHVWEDKGDDVRKTDDDGEPLVANDDAPVGSGPYVLQDVSEDSYTLSANPQYWYGNHPVVPRVVYKATTSDDEVKELVADHELDWMEIFLPKYGEKFEKNGYTMLNTPMDVVAIYACSDEDLGCEGQQTHPAVREALHLAMDRELINDAVYNGYGGPVNLGLTPVPGELKWIGDKVADQEHEKPDIEAAKQVLEDDGYRLNQSGVYEKDDQPLELELHTVADWSDYHTVATLVVEQANKVGIDLTLTTISPEEFAHMRNEGEFELMIGGISAPPTIDPYQVYSGWYGGQATEPVGTELGAGQWNFARYTNDDVDEAIRHATTTADRDEKLAAYATIQAAITEDLPYIPLITSPVQVFVNTTDFDGWPSQDNMYAYPSPVGGLSTGLILRAIEPVD